MRAFCIWGSYVSNPLVYISSYTYDGFSNSFDFARSSHSLKSYSLQALPAL
jgi:hypothetical protein